MQNGPRLPIVAIVGRPNVGKSTLFNRFAGSRRALVEDQPGVTRHRVAQEVEVEGRRLLLVDTAGLDPAADEGLAGAVQAQARAALVVRVIAWWAEDPSRATRDEIIDTLLELDPRRARDGSIRSL